MVNNGFLLQQAEGIELAIANMNVTHQHCIQGQCQIDDANVGLKVLTESHVVYDRFDETFPDFELENIGLNVQINDAQDDLFQAQHGQSAKATAEHLNNDLSQEKIGAQLLANVFPEDFSRDLYEKIAETSKMLHRSKAFAATTNEWHLSDDFQVRIFIQFSFNHIHLNIFTHVFR